MIHTKSYITIEDYISRTVRKFRLIVAQRNKRDATKFWNCLRCGRVNERLYPHCQECGHLKSWRNQGR